jgi:Flp pilus assembly protein TadG
MLAGRSKSASQRIFGWTRWPADVYSAIGMKGTIRFNRCRGSNLVEFALTLPLLALLLFGIIQYGFIFGAYVTIRNASSVAARYASLSSPTPTVDQIRSVARGALTPMLSSNTSASVVTVNTNTTVAGVGGAKSVKIDYSLKLIIPFVVPGKSAGGSLTISATTVMR